MIVYLQVRDNLVTDCLLDESGNGGKERDRTIVAHFPFLAFLEDRLELGNLAVFRETILRTRHLIGGSISGLFSTVLHALRIFMLIPSIPREGLV